MERRRLEGEVKSWKSKFNNRPLKECKETAAQCRMYKNMLDSKYVYDLKTRENG